MVKRPHWQCSGLGPRLKVPLISSRGWLSTASVALTSCASKATSLVALTIQVAQLCFEAALPLVEEEAAAGGDAGAASLQAGCTRAFDQLHASAVAVSDRAGTPIQPPTTTLLGAGVRRSPSRPATLYALQVRRSPSSPGTGTVQS